MYYPRGKQQQSTHSLTHSLTLALLHTGVVSNMCLCVNALVDYWHQTLNTPTISSSHTHSHTHSWRPSIALSSSSVHRSSVSEVREQLRLECSGRGAIFSAHAASICRKGAIAKCFSYKRWGV